MPQPFPFRAFIQATYSSTYRQSTSRLLHLSTILTLTWNWLRDCFRASLRLGDQWEVCFLAIWFRNCREGKICHIQAASATFQLNCDSAKFGKFLPQLQVIPRDQISARSLCISFELHRPHDNQVKFINRNADFDRGVYQLLHDFWFLPALPIRLPALALYWRLDRQNLLDPSLSVPHNDTPFTVMVTPKSLPLLNRQISGAGAQTCRVDGSSQ